MQIISPPAHKHHKLLLTASMPSRDTKHTETHRVQEGSTSYISHEQVWNCLSRNTGFPFQPVPAEPRVAMEESPRNQIMNHKSVFLSYTSSKYCWEIPPSPSVPVSCITNHRELWQSTRYTPMLAASSGRYKSFPLPLVRRWNLNMLQGGIYPRVKSFLPARDRYLTLKRRCGTGMSYNAWHCLVPQNHLKLARICTGT